MVYKNINWLSVNKNQMAKNIKLTKWSGLKIKRIILKRIKEYPQVTQHRENDCERRMAYNSARIRGKEIIHQNHINTVSI